jgi:hypothetical protein
VIAHLAWLALLIVGAGGAVSAAARRYTTPLMK